MPSDVSPDRVSRTKSLPADSVNDQPGAALKPREIEPVDTTHRKISSPFPHPESLEVLDKLGNHEPLSMSGQPPVVWDRAEGIHVFDRWGNQWLDWSSGVLVANAGHCHPRIAKAVLEQVEHGLMHNYCFPSKIRSDLVAALAKVAPDGLDKVFLLTTGSEAVECAIKLMRSAGRCVGGDRKIGIVTFSNAFHGRTMGSQMAGGIDSLKDWIVNVDPAMVQVPFPEGFRQRDVRFDVFLESIRASGLGPDDIAGVMLETYQGGSAQFAPTEYIRQLRRWCDEHNIVLTFDEVQAGFGRTGKFWGFEHYRVEADLICCGKGITSGMPLSAVIGRPDLMNLCGPNSMTSTHTGNPICGAAALANLAVIEEEKLVDNAARMGAILDVELRRIVEQFGGPFGPGVATGLVGTVQVVRPQTTDPDPGLAKRIVWRCVETGLLMFAPVGVGGGTLKISPPLCIPEDALREGIATFEQAIADCV